MPLSSGARLGPYTITAPIGAGGMGEVYRARDTRLDRDVAIKILPPAFAADGERLARFEREAKTLAALNHPHIAQIYGIEGTALVMELVEGEDLSARMARGAMPLDEALLFAGQIADALEAAHERGIVHRDLKPANIRITADGGLKVLDFGLAKAIDESGPAADAQNSPTMSIAGTRAGLILGTAAYMAPEQARGHIVDRRADIWAFGVVLFEMLAGQQAFAGETISDVLASVLKNDINWGALPKDLPLPVMSLLKRCLHPDRKLRLRDIGEARIAIADYLANPVVTVQPAPVAAWPRLTIVAVAVAIVASAIALGMLAFRGSAVEPAPMRFVVTPPAGILANATGRPSIAIAPDGWTLVFTGLDKGAARLYIRGRDDFEPRLIAGTEDGGNPVFSPSGGSIAFFTTGQLKVMRLEGTPRTIAVVNDPRGVSWVDETRLFYTPESIGGLFEIDVNGGAPRQLTTLDEATGERTHRWPHVLPGGRWVLFTVGTTSSPDSYDDSRIDAVDRTTGERRAIFTGATSVQYAPTGHLVFTRGGSLFAVPFDPQALRVSGSPTSVLQEVGGDWTTGAAHVAFSPGGTLAFVPGDHRGGQRQLFWSDLKGQRQPIPLPPALYNDVRLSPDGSRAAVVDGTSGAADIRVYAFARGTFTRLTFTSRSATPIWSADGRQVYFTSVDPGRPGSQILRTSPDGGREPELLVSLDLRAYLKHVSADGKWAIVHYFSYGGARANIGRLSLTAGAKIEPIVDTPFDEFGAVVSPNERYIAYQSDEGNLPQVYVREIGRSSGRWQVSNDGGEEPMWSSDGRWLYFRIDGRMMRAAVHDGDVLQFGVPSMMFDGVYQMRSDTGVSYDLHPDGTRMIMTTAADGGSIGSVRVMTRWFDQLTGIK